MMSGYYGNGTGTGMMGGSSHGSYDWMMSQAGYRWMTGSGTAVGTRFRTPAGSRHPAGCPAVRWVPGGWPVRACPSSSVARAWASSRLPSSR
jgi:hypothetical protein